MIKTLNNDSHESLAYQAALEIARETEETLQRLCTAVLSDDLVTAKKLARELIANDEERKPPNNAGSARPVKQTKRVKRTKQDERIKNPHTNSRLISFDEASAMLNLHSSTIRKRKADTDKLTHVRLGRRTMVIREEVEALINQRIKEGRERELRVQRILDSIPKPAIVHQEDSAQ